MRSFSCCPSPRRGYTAASRFRQLGRLPNIREQRCVFGNAHPLAHPFAPSSAGGHMLNPGGRGWVTLVLALAVVMWAAASCRGSADADTPEAAIRRQADHIDKSQW